PHCDGLYFATIEGPSTLPEITVWSAPRLTKNDAISRAGTPAPLASFYRTRRKLGWLAGALRRPQRILFARNYGIWHSFYTLRRAGRKQGATMLRPRPASPLLAAAQHAKERDRRP